MKPTLNLERRSLMNGIVRGKVRNSSGGVALWRSNEHGLARNVNRRVRELVDAGWVRLGADGFYELTDAGNAELLAATNPPYFVNTPIRKGVPAPSYAAEVLADAETAVVSGDLAGFHAAFDRAVLDGHGIWVRDAKPAYLSQLQRQGLV